MRYNIGMMLGLNISSFRSGMRGAAAEVRGFERVQNAAQRRMMRAQAQMARQGAVLTTYVAGLYAGVAAFTSLVAAASKFDYQARALSAVMKTNVSWGKQFHKTVLNYNSALKEFNPEQITTVARALSQAGYDMKTGGVANVSAVLNAISASLGAIGTNEAVELGINLERGFGRGRRSMTELLDVAVEGSNMFPMTLDKITTSMGYATESAVSYGQSLESVVVAIGALMPVVKTASKAGVAYRNTMAAIARPVTAKFMEKHGIHIRNTAGNYRDLMDIVADIYAATGKMRKKDLDEGTHKYEQLIHKMFGIRGKSLFAAFQQLPETVRGPGGHEFQTPTAAYDFLRSKLALAGGASARLAASMRESTEIIDQRFNSAINRVTVELGEQLSPTLNRLKKLATGILDGLMGARKSAHIGRPGFKFIDENALGQGIVSAIGEHMAPFLLGLTGAFALALTKVVALFGFALYRSMGYGGFGPANQISSGAGFRQIAGGWRGWGHRGAIALGIAQPGGRVVGDPSMIDKGSKASGRYGATTATHARYGAGRIAGGLLNLTLAAGGLYMAFQMLTAATREQAKALHGLSREKYHRDADQRMSQTQKAVRYFLDTVNQKGSLSKQQVVDMSSQGILGTVLLMRQLHKDNRGKDAYIKAGGYEELVNRVYATQRARLKAHIGSGPGSPEAQARLKTLETNRKADVARVRRFMAKGKDATSKSWQDKVLEEVSQPGAFRRGLTPEALHMEGMRRGGKRMGISPQMAHYLYLLREYRQSTRRMFSKGRAEFPEAVGGFPAKGGDYWHPGGFVNQLRYVRDADGKFVRDKITKKPIRKMVMVRRFPQARREYDLQQIARATGIPAAFSALSDKEREKIESVARAASGGKGGIGSGIPTDSPWFSLLRSAESFTLGMSPESAYKEAHSPAFQAVTSMDQYEAQLKDLNAKQLNTLETGELHRVQSGEAATAIISYLQSFQTNGMPMRVQVPETKTP